MQRTALRAPTLMPKDVRQDRMSLFTTPVDGADEHFADLALGTDSRSQEARALVGRLAGVARPFLDRDFALRLRSAFQQGFWEAHLCATLHEMGLPVVQRDKRRKRDSGPDIQVGNVEGWFEAIAVTAGEGADAVPPQQFEGVAEVPDAKIKLRLTSALCEKSAKLDGYRRSDLVRPSEPCVVAINAGSVPYAHKELDVPRIVRSVFPIGWPVVSLDTGNGTFSDAGFEHRVGERKKSGAEVATDSFLEGGSPSVSAILYSAATPYSLLHHEPSAEFVLVHNPAANDPLPRGYVHRGREYWLDEDRKRVCCKRHDV